MSGIADSSRSSPDVDCAGPTGPGDAQVASGRDAGLDRAAIAGLVGALSRLLDPATAATAAAVTATAATAAAVTATAAMLATPAGLAFTDARPIGGAWLLDGLWRRLGIPAAITRGVTGCRCDVQRIERTLFALVANRALCPSGTPTATGWITHDVFIPGLDGVVDETCHRTVDEACHRALDTLADLGAHLSEEIFEQVTDLLDLDVDLLFLDTIATSFELDSELGTVDEPVVRDRRGHGRDHRSDLPQTVVGMAVTRTGIPVRVWSWPADTPGDTLASQIRADTSGWSPGRIVRVADRGFPGAADRGFPGAADRGFPGAADHRPPGQGDGHRIVGEKLRAGTADVDAAVGRAGRYAAVGRAGRFAAVGRAGRYATVADDLRVKEIHLPDTSDRVIICHNPHQAERDRHARADLLTRLGELIAGSDLLTAARRGELREKIAARPGFARFLHVTDAGLLRIDHARVRAEARYDGKYLVRSSNHHLSAADIALGYRQLLEVERGWRGMKQTIDLRPFCRGTEDHIRAHALLCWLALLLIRIVETATGQTWPAVRDQLQRLHLITFTGPAGTFRQTTGSTGAQRALFSALHLDPPGTLVEIVSGTGPDPTDAAPRDDSPDEGRAEVAPVTVVPPPRADIGDGRRAEPCPVCRTPFTPIRRQRYCTPACRQAAWRARHAPVPRPAAV